MSRKPYVKKQAAGWWLRDPVFRLYMLREATALPLFAYGLFLLYGLYCLYSGSEAFLSWLALSRSPVLVAMQLVAFAAAVFHAYTWIELVPKILVLDTPPVKLGGGFIKRAHQLLAITIFVALTLFVVLSGDAGAATEILSLSGRT